MTNICTEYTIRKTKILTLVATASFMGASPAEINPLYISHLTTVDPGFNEPLYHKVLSATNGILLKRYPFKMSGTEPRYD